MYKLDCKKKKYGNIQFLNTYEVMFDDFIELYDILFYEYYTLCDFILYNRVK